MDSSSSASSCISDQTSSSREPTPEYDPIAAYNALAPLWWDERDFDFSVESEDDESLTDGEDNLQFLVDGELEGDSEDDAISWGEDISSEVEDESEEDSSSDDYPPMKRRRVWSAWSDDEEAPDGAHLGAYISSDESLDGFDSSEDADDEDSTDGDDDGANEDEDEDDDDYSP